jgi:hypothetical protein
MEDKITCKTEEEGIMYLNLRSGEKIPVKTITRYTNWESGRQDCNIEITEVLNSTNVKL